MKERNKSTFQSRKSVIVITMKSVIVITMSLYNRCMRTEFSAVLFLVIRNGSLSALLGLIPLQYD